MSTSGNVKRALRTKAPAVYKAGMLAKNFVKEQTVGRVGQRQAARLVTSRTPLTADIDGNVGMGGLLSWAGRSLVVAQAHDIDLALRFTAPTYMPSWPTKDWLDCYFDRLGPLADGRPVVPVHLLPKVSERSVPDLAPLVWGALAPNREVIALADKATPAGRFAAVHFRGSDKYLEAPRVAADTVLRAVETEMRRDGLQHLFVASDEPEFLSMARERFGEDSSMLEGQATAVDGVPPHMLDVPGEIKAREALATMLVLSRAALCARTESLMSEWAVTLPGERRVALLTPETLAA